MRYIVNSDNFVAAVSFGSDVIYNDCLCTEYTGSVPENYTSLEEWYLEEELTLWRWKIIDGELILDESATAPEEGKWGVPELQSKTVTPTTSSQTVKADEGYDGLEKVTVNRIPTSYVKPVATRGAETITPGVDDQYIGSGVYCSGLQTIKGDSDLKASNIKSGVSIFGVDGSYSAKTRITAGAKTPYCASDLCMGVNLDTKNLVALCLQRYAIRDWDMTDLSTTSLMLSCFLDIENETLLFTAASETGTSASMDAAPYIRIDSDSVEFKPSSGTWYDISDERYYIFAIYSE